MKYVTEITTIVDYNNFDEFVSQHYGMPYEFASDEEVQNDSSHRYQAKKEPLDEFEERALEAFVDSGYHSFLSDTIIKDLVNKGILPEGSILVEVSW